METAGTDLIQMSRDLGKKKSKGTRSAIRQYRWLFFFGILFILLGGVTSYACIRVGTIPSNSSPPKYTGIGDFGWKIADFLAQVVLVAVGGGIFLQASNRLQSRKAASNQFLKDALAKLIASYSETKKVRRTLRATSKIAPAEPHGILPFEKYNELMAIINETQLSLEVIRREIDVFRRILEDPCPLIECIRGMEEYLGRLITEWENASKISHYDTGISLSKLDHLRTFIEQRDTGDFRRVFTDQFVSALRLLVAERVRVG